ncbi:MAG: hypothetical protein IPJ40_00605 [Saprospirales bacterium]|nr:hypothetical protein [Saprospirales bacterium]
MTVFSVGLGTLVLVLLPILDTSEGQSEKKAGPKGTLGRKQHISGIALKFFKVLQQIDQLEPYDKTEHPIGEQLRPGSLTSFHYLYFFSHENPFFLFAS